MQIESLLSTFIKLPIVIKILVLSILAAVLHRFYCIYTNNVVAIF